MTNEQIIEMAKQAGLHVATDVNWMPVIGLAYAKKLVEMATQHEREACAKICETLELPEWPDKVRQPLAQAIRARRENV